MASSVQSAHMELAAWVGSDHLSDDPAVCRAAAVDGKAPALVVYPSTAEEVAGILRIAALSSAGQRSTTSAPPKLRADCRSRRMVEPASPRSR